MVRAHHRAARPEDDDRPGRELERGVEHGLEPRLERAPRARSSVEARATPDALAAIVLRRDLVELALVVICTGLRR
jgi:hypothetical protein